MGFTRMPGARGLGGASPWFVGGCALRVRRWVTLRASVAADSWGSAPDPANLIKSRGLRRARVDGTPVALGGVALLWWLRWWGGFVTSRAKSGPQAEGDVKRTKSVSV